MKNLRYKRTDNIRKRLRCLMTFLLSWLLAFSVFSLKTQAQSPSSPVEHVIMIAADAGGGKYLKKFIEESPEEFKNFKRLLDEGAATFNARADYFVTVTQPNFTCMITGRPSQTVEDVQGAIGHYWIKNYQFPGEDAPASLHAVNPEKKYTYSIFDVAHDNGLTTGLYWAPNRFYRLAKVSYGPEYGRNDKNGRNKVDFIVGDDPKKRISALKNDHPNLAFIYFVDADAAGHKFGYLGEEYRHALSEVDGYIGEILDFVENDPRWKDKTVLLFTADHGGKPGTKGHGDFLNPYVYTVPFIAWGPSVKKGVDLYEINKSTRRDPGDGRPEYATSNQPVRNGDIGNLALKLLNLPSVPQSFINQKQDLNIR